MKRIYDEVIKKHFANDQQILFIAGARQVGKTTVAQNANALTDSFTYLDWDNQNHREIILQGPEAVAQYAHLEYLTEKLPIIAFDEIHKFSLWKEFLKGFYDTYHEKTHTIVTGSAKLDVYKAGGDSLMGRYFLYRIHPLSVAECITTKIIETEIRKPNSIPPTDWKNLLEFGGFPEPFSKQNKSFSLRWQNLRSQQLFREDIIDLTKIQDIARLEILAELLKQQAGSLTSYSQLAKKLRISVDTTSRWIKTLESFYYCFSLHPWTKNITRSLLKEPKIFLWDWSLLSDPGAKMENFVACHLMKATQFWTDQGLGDYKLYFIRDLEKNEVDFLVSKNDQAWFLVEVKASSNGGISKHLYKFQKQTGAPHAFQVVFDLEYVDKDCFSINDPVIVPVRTFLSQLV